jgi:hypothetical protein
MKHHHLSFSIRTDPLAARQGSQLDKSLELRLGLLIGEIWMTVIELGTHLRANLPDWGCVGSNNTTPDTLRTQISRPLLTPA